MKTQHTLGLAPTFTGDNDALPFAEVLTMLGRAGATGIVLATANDGQRFEVRLVAGEVVRLTGRTGQARAAVAAELIGVEELAWSWRRTAAAPRGEEPVTVERLFLEVAFTAAAA